MEEIESKVEVSEAKKYMKDRYNSLRKLKKYREVKDSVIYRLIASEVSAKYKSLNHYKESNVRTFFNKNK